MLASGCDVRGKTLYQEAVEHIGERDYASALVLLEEIPDYRDAMQLADACRDQMCLQQLAEVYENARALEEAADYRAAEEAFSALGDYSDAFERAADCARQADEQTVSRAAARITAFSSKGDWDAGLDSVVYELDECDDSPSAAYFADALRLLAAGDGQGALEQIKKAKAQNAEVLSDTDWAKALRSLLAVRLDDEKTALSLYWLLRGLSPEAEPAAATGTEKPLRITDFARPDKAGASPSGKVLVYVTHHNYVGEDEAYLDFDRMELLPQSLVPASIDELAYIIEVRYDYKFVKKFTTYYNQGVQEYAVISVHNLVTGRDVGDELTVLAPAARSLRTAKLTSEFVSGGPPSESEINEKLVRAIGRLSGGPA